jgi:hypothetical protein
VVQVPKDWAPFFLTMLSTPKHFDWAKTFLASFSWKVMTKHRTPEENLSFALPKSCPDGEHIICEIQESASKQPEPEHVIRENRSQDSSPLSESAYRRSLRIKSRNGGFRNNSCISKNCLACSSIPPAIPRSSLQNIDVSACNIPAEKLTEKALKSKPKSFKVIRDKLNSNVASGKGQKPKKRSRARVVMMMLMLTRTEDLIEEMSLLQIPPSQMSGLMILFKALAFCCFLSLELCWFCLSLATTLKLYQVGPFISGYVDCFGSGMIYLTLVLWWSWLLCTKVLPHPAPFSLFLINE